MLDYLDQIPRQYWLYAGGAVALLALAAWRYRTDRRWFGRDTAATWRTLRVTLVPLLGRVARRLDPHVPEDVYVRTTVTPEEHVATVEASHEALLDDLANAGYEPQPLASLASDWNGQTELASWARYYGEPLFDGAPDWLRARQVHVRLFRDPDELAIRVTAHEEATPWAHPIDHYRAETMDVDLGRRLAARDLGVTLEEPPES